MTHPTDAAIAQAWAELFGSPGSDPLFDRFMRRARELDVAKPEQVHTCSYECDRPACIKGQRDELRDRLEGLDTAKGGLTEAQKADRDAVLYGAGYMMDGKHVPLERITIATPPAQAAEAVEYRMLDRKDFLEADDEFLDDDCATWLRAGVHARLFLGQPYKPGFHKPARRAAIAAMRAKP